MSFHLLAFAKAPQTKQTEILLPPLADSIFGVNGNYATLPQDVWLAAAYVENANIDHAYITIPSFVGGILVIRPLSANSGPPTNPNVMDFTGFPFPLKALDQIAVDCSAKGAADANSTALLALADKIEEIPQGQVFNLMYSSTTAGAATPGWATLSLSFMQVLPAGTYAVIGMEHYATGGNVYAARLVFNTQTFRPGTIGNQNLSSRTHAMFYDGSLGVWGKFHSTTPPGVEVYADANANSHAGTIKLVRIGP